MFGDSYGSDKAIIMHLNVTWILINSAFFVIIICSVVSMMIFVVCLYSDVFPPQSIGVHLKVLFSHLPHIFLLLIELKKNNSLFCKDWGLSNLKQSLYYIFLESSRVILSLCLMLLRPFFQLDQNSFKNIIGPRVLLIIYNSLFAFSKSVSVFWIAGWSWISWRKKNHLVTEPPRISWVSCQLEEFQQFSSVFSKHAQFLALRYSLKMLTDALLTLLVFAPSLWSSIPSKSFSVCIANR